LKSQNDSDSQPIFRTLWHLLRGRHIDIDSSHYEDIKERQEEVSSILDALGFRLIHDEMGFFYLQRDTKSEETITSAKICTLFYVSIQRLQETKDTANPLDINFLLDRKGFDLDTLLSHTNLDDTLSRLLRDVELVSDEKIQDCLKDMNRLNFIERLPSGNWRFRRAASRLEQAARKYADYEEEE
jgi:hypothetical protein